MRLQAEHDALPPAGADDRISSKSGRHEIAEQIKALRDAMEASRVEFVLRTLTPDEFKLVQADAQLPDAEQKISEYDQLAWQSTAPPECDNPALYADLPQLTAAKWKALADRIGMRQFSDLLNDANALVLTKVAVPDFSRSVSETLSPRTPSEN